MHSDHLDELVDKLLANGCQLPAAPSATALLSSLTLNPLALRTLSLIAHTQRINLQQLATRNSSSSAGSRGKSPVGLSALRALRLLPVGQLIQAPECLPP